MKRWMLAALAAALGAAAAAQTAPVPPQGSQPVSIPTAPTFSTSTAPGRTQIYNPGFRVPQTNSMGPPAAQRPPYSFVLQGSSETAPTGRRSP